MVEQPQKRTVTVRGTPVHVVEIGAGRPIVLLHGFGLDHHFMTVHYEPLFADRAGWRRIYPDMPGMGRTPAADWITAEDDMLDVLLGLLDALAPGERLVVAGMSWGGYLAQGLAWRRPGQLDGLLLSASSVFDVLGDRDLPARSLVWADPGVRDQLAPEELGWLEMATVQTPETLAAFRASVRPEGPGDEAFLERLVRRFGPDIVEGTLPGPIDAPALIVAGRQDHVVGYRDPWRLLELLPRATFAALDRAGHGLEIDQPGLFRVLAAEWLDRVEEWVMARETSR